MSTLPAPSPSRVIALEVLRKLLNRFAIRGRFRLAYAISRVCLPQGKIVLRHTLGDMMVFDFSNPSEVSMYFDFFAPGLSQLLRRELHPGDSFVDCGASMGYFSCLASSLVGPTGKVFSIDANPFSVERIRESAFIGNYGNMHIVLCAIGDHEGNVEFHLASDPMHSSLADLNALGWTSTKSTITVPLRTLDDVLRDNLVKHGKRVRLLKLDVEGAEMDVIGGAEATINSKTLESIYVEVHERDIRLRVQEPTVCENLLAARGFKVAERYGKHAFLYKADE